jgi:predicted acetyltransferase
VAEIREQTDEDTDAVWALGSLTFGYHKEQRPENWSAVPPGRIRWGAYDDAGGLLMTAADREQGHWFGGRLVPASGIAGVAVAAEARGGGLARAVLTRLMQAARERGALISTLFNTTPVPYRRLGWEEVGALVTSAVPAMVFEGLRRPEGTSTRAATVEDMPAIAELYRAVARDGTGLMERPWYEEKPQRSLEEWDGLTIVEGRAGVAGFCAWDRGPGYDATGRIIVGDLIGADPDATTALLATLAGWASVAPTVTLQLPDLDPVYLTTTAGIHARPELRQPWMLRLLDAAGAVAARGWSPHLRGSVDLSLADPECPWNAGDVRLVLDGGQGRLEPGGRGTARLTPRGLALWYAGAATPAALRRLGLLTGGTEGDTLLQVATAGPRPALLDYF